MLIMDKKKLVIIGNGFDLHHGLKTSYYNYRAYLENQNAEILSRISSIYKQLGITYLENDLWNDVEGRIPDIYQHIAYEYIIPSCSDNDAIIGEMLLEKLVNTLNSFTGEIFATWLIDTYNQSINKCNKKLQELFTQISDKALFINFNYTQTLEHIYDVNSKSILYVHGKLQSIMNRQHELGNESSLLDNNLVHNEIEFGASDVRLEEIINSIKKNTKNTDEIITLSASPTKHLREKYKTIENFINGKEFEEVLVIGHSLSGDDLRYFDEIIIPKCRKDKWTVYYYDNDDKKVKESFLLSKGIEKMILRAYEDKI